MILCNINQGLMNNEQSRSPTYSGSSPQKPWNGRLWAHVAIYIWIININLLNTVIFWSFFFFLILGGLFNFGERLCFSSVNNFFIFCAFFPSFISDTSILSINFRANLHAQNAGNGISRLQISKIFWGSMPPHMQPSAIAIPL